MDPMEALSEENRRLRRTMRDVIALSTLPAVWVGLGPEGIARSLADVLLNTLSLDLVYVRLPGTKTDRIIEVIRSPHQPESVPDPRLNAAVASFLESARSASSATIADPFAAGPLHVALTRFGMSDEHGVLVAGSRRAEFPSERDRLLMSVGANQTAIVVQRKRAEEQVREQREWLQVTLASIGDAVIATDTEGQVTFLNAAAEQLTGWAEREARGKPLDTIFAIFNETTRQPAKNPVDQVRREGGVVGLANHTILIAKDGTERPIDDSAAPIRDAAGQMIGIVLIFRDVAQRRQADRQRNARLGVTQALGEGGPVEHVIRGVLQAVCDNLDWDMGLFWSVNEAGNALVCRHTWHRPGLPLEGFAEASRSRTLQPGEGLPGRAWASGQPARIPTLAADTNFPRSAAAAEVGLHSAFACPVTVGGQPLGVLEFVARRIQEPDTDLLEMMGTIAGSVGQFIEKKTAEDDLRRSEQELADFFENAAVGLHWVGPDGTIVRANRAELEMLGYTRDEYVGRSIRDVHVDPDVIGDILDRLQSGEKLHEYPARLRRKDGSLKDVLIDSSVLWTEGAFVHTRCFTRDVTEQNAAEARARAEEQRTRTILESITDAFCALDRDWQFTYVNGHAETLLGRSRQDLLGTTYWVEYPDTVGTAIEDNLRHAVAENVTISFEHFYAPHDRWYDIRAYPSAEGLSLYFRDVSEGKKSELALRDSEKRFRELADAMPQLVWTARPDGNIDYLNRGWTEFSGLSDTVGNAGWSSLLHPDEAQSAGERWVASVRSGARFDMELRLLDRRHQSYRWYLIRTVPVHDDAGHVTRWFGTGTDIHEQKCVEWASRYLAEASAELAGAENDESTLRKVATLAVPYFADWSAVDLVHEGGLRRLAVAHQDPQKVEIAHELMRAYPPDPHAPGGVMAVLRSGQPEMVGEITDAMLVQRAKDERHLHLIRSLGLRSYICVPLVISGETLGVFTFATAESGRTYSNADLALAVDLAHRAGVAMENTRLYQALRDADLRKDEFLATLAHELRNPLAPIRNALQILRMPRVDVATLDRSHAILERQVHHIVRLVDDLLDVSRVMRGKIELRKEAVELATIVARAVETVQPLLDAQGHIFDIRLPSESLLVDADPVRLAQVVSNLLTNAAKYTDPHGHISLTAEHDGQTATLRVRDTGIGIAPQMLPRIFDLFVQVDPGAARSQGGLGIGLTLVKNLVEMHNGTIEAHSKGINLGTELVVRLPLSASRLLRHGPRDTTTEAEAPNVPSGRRLLVVDDNEDAAITLATLLRLLGHEVQVAFSGVAALEATKDYCPDVVFLDIGMPGMDGYEVARRMRRQPGLEKVVLAALTGWGQQEDRRRTAEAGFDHHLVKPPEPDVLERLLST